MGKAQVGGSLVEKEEASSGTHLSASPQSIHLALTTLLAPLDHQPSFRMDDREAVMAAKLIDRRFHNVPGMYLVICTVEIHEEPKPLLTDA